MERTKGVGVNHHEERIEMTEQEMQIAVAESMGWTGCFVATGKEEWLGTFAAEYEGRLLGFKPWADDSAYDVPNFPQDPNAIRGVELTLGEPVERDSYIRYICVILDLPLPLEANPLNLWWHVKSAHPKVCCEAYLRVKGLFKE